MVGTIEMTVQVHLWLFIPALIDRSVEKHGVKIEIAKLERLEVEEG